MYIDNFYGIYSVGRVVWWVFHRIGYTAPQLRYFVSISHSLIGCILTDLLFTDKGMKKNL